MDGSKEQSKMTAGLDLGDKYSYLCLIDTLSGEVVEEGRLRTTPKALGRRFASASGLLCAKPWRRVPTRPGSAVPWRGAATRCWWPMLARQGSSTLEQAQETDEVDAENLAHLACLDPKLLYPVRHRGEDSQAHMAIIRSRQALVGSRTQLVSHVPRGAVKSFGARLPKCPARSFHKRASEHIPEALLLRALEPVLEQIASLTECIRDYDRKLEAISEDHYPQTELLCQVEGVGALTALTFVLTLEDPCRFERSRSVGAGARHGPLRGEGPQEEAHFQGRRGDA